ncbi:uncharacterized protein LOC141667106 [Apium graveolens]|uniref:uncharacterized protein LOC141667106 n=1 Tax=Apium graveolens TaxID=4045 RepID=UPI003D794EED
MDLAEVYRVIYDGPDDYLQGIIVSIDEESGGQFLFAEKDLDRNGEVGAEEIRKYLNVELYTDAKKKLEMPLIKSEEHIMLNGPTKASICAAPGFSLILYLCGVIYGYVTFSPEWFSAPLHKEITSRTGNRCLTILYAVFQNAAEAHVKVKLNNVNSAFGLYGIINARTSAIKHTAYSSILFFKNKDEPEKIKEGPGSGDEIFIPLSRPLVAVPLESELILEINLHSDDNGEILKDRVTFTAKEGEQSSKYGRKKCNKGEVTVEVSWRYKSKLRELIEQEEAMSIKD